MPRVTLNTTQIARVTSMSRKKRFVKLRSLLLRFVHQISPQRFGRRSDYSNDSIQINKGNSDAWRHINKTDLQNDNQSNLLSACRKCDVHIDHHEHLETSQKTQTIGPTLLRPYLQILGVVKSNKDRLAGTDSGRATTIPAPSACASIFEIMTRN